MLEKIWRDSLAFGLVLVALMVVAVKNMPSLLDDTLSIATVLMVFFVIWTYTKHADEQDRKRDRETWGRNY